MAIFPELDKKKYSLFFIINSLAVLICIASVGLVREFKSQDIQLFLTAITIIFLQYPFLNNAKTWRGKSVIFYLSFLAFCFSFTLLDIWQETAQLNDLNSLAGLIARGFAFNLFGHLYGLVFFPLIVTLNIWLGKYYFDNKIIG